MNDESSSKPHEQIRTELNLHQKIIKIMEKVSFIEKTGNVSMGNSGSYKAILHDDVTSLLHPHCANWGIVIVPSVTKCEVQELRNIKTYNGKSEEKISYRADVWVDVEFINADKPEERILSKTFSYAMDSSDKATGKAYSMAVKYAYLKVFMLQSGDNEEARDYERETFNQNMNNSRNNSGNTANQNSQRTSNENFNNRNNNGNGSNGSQGQQKENNQKISQASENQIKAIKSLCDKKGIKIEEKFSSKEKCSSQEASSEISRINAIKA